MKLMIVESPSKTKKIASYLGNGWKVMASFGHIRDLPVKEIGVVPPEFAPNYVVSDRSKAHVSKLKDAVKSAEAVYLATDPDREGEAISWHLEQVLKLRGAKRVTFQEITKSALTKALASPRAIDYKLVRSQECRRVADRLVGYMVSPALSNKTGQRLSAGRVQSVAVRLVCDREREIESFVPVEYLMVRLFFTTEGFAWYADWDSERMLPEGQKYFQDREFAELLATIRHLVVDSIDKKKTTSPAPPPFTTSTLLQAASSSLKYDAKKAMALAQSLFEEGLITYHRTDSRNLSDDAIASITAWLRSNGFAAEVPEKPNRWEAKEGAQEAHEAIRPTNVEERTPPIADSEAAALYKLIWERAVASQMVPAYYDVTTVRLNSTEKVRDAVQPFIAKGRVPLSLGWLRLAHGDKTEDVENKDKDEYQLLPALTEGVPLEAKAGQVLERATKPPPRYTEASLIKKLEGEGIGRPSTYAAIMGNIVSRNYVAITKRKLFCTDIGKLVCDSLVGKFQFLEIPYTRDLEDDLDKIAVGSADYLSIITELHSKLSGEIGVLNSSAEPVVANARLCPACGRVMARRKSKKGENFWGCSGFPVCKTTAPDEHAAPKKAKAAPKGSAKKVTKCPSCEKPMVLRKGSRGEFWGCSGYPVCKQTKPVTVAKKKAAKKWKVDA